MKQIILTKEWLPCKRINIRHYVVVAFVILCLITPFTNWMIPLISKYTPKIFI